MIRITEIRHTSNRYRGDRYRLAELRSEIIIHRAVKQSKLENR